MENIAVYCLKYGESVLDESSVFDGGNIEKQIDISFAVYLIQWGKKNILIDAGCETMPGFHMKNFYSPIWVLEQMGLCSADITDVIVTHAHHDHLECVKYYENAVVHITKEEYEKGIGYIPTNMELHIFEGEYKLNSKIRIIEWKGHSIGSSIVELTTNDMIHVFAGDECYINVNIEKKLCTGCYFDKEKAKEFIEKYSSNKYCVHTCHDDSLKTDRII